MQYKYKNTTFTHTNLMLQSGYVSYYYEYASGIKTGSTEEAGYCVITKASKDGYNYLAVVLGAIITATAMWRSARLLTLRPCLTGPLTR